MDEEICASGSKTDRRNLHSSESYAIGLIACTIICMLYIRLTMEKILYLSLASGRHNVCVFDRDSDEMNHLEALTIERDKGHTRWRR